MKIDESGGASANDRLEERLASRFATKLDRAERDYPALRLRPRGAAESGRRRRAWPRLVAVSVGIVALLVVVIVGSPPAL
jgi:type VI protein secretion system component VasF